MLLLSTAVQIPRVDRASVQQLLRAAPSAGRSSSVSMQQPLAVVESSSIATHQPTLHHHHETTHKLHRHLDGLNLPHDVLARTWVLNTTMVGDECTPILCFVNGKAGKGEGLKLKDKLKLLVNPDQIVDVSEVDIEMPLKIFAELPRYKILVCGGDGTISSVLNCVEKIHNDAGSKGHIPGVAILPLGTGNDLSIVLGWGRCFRKGGISGLLQAVKTSDSVHVDRWQVRIDNKVETVFQNYFGIGIDASITLQCTEMRNNRPYLHFNRQINKLWYGWMGLTDFLRGRCVDFEKQVEIHVDGELVTLPPKTQGIVVLSINSYASGDKLWHDNELHRYAPSSMTDGLFEIVAIRSPAQLGKMKWKLSRLKKVAQGSRLSIKTAAELPLQADGEPWVQQPCEVLIQPAEAKAHMLRPAH